MKHFLSIWISLALSLMFNQYVLAAPPVERPSSEKAISGSFIIYMDPGVDKGPVKNFVKNKGGVVAHEYVGIRAVNVRNLPEAALEGLSNMPGVSRIWQDRVVHAYLAQSIPQIRANATGVVDAYGYGTRVCILDTGIDNNHPAFSGRIVAQKDFVNGDDIAQDDEGHGTHVAGIVASADPIYRGVARGANLIAGKVLDARGSGYFSDVVAGIDWCAYTANADIISMSLGGGKFTGFCDNDPAAQASNNAVTSGVVVVAASGNDGWNDAMGTPACGSKVIAVGGVYDSNWTWVKWGCLNTNCSLYMCKDEPAAYDTRFCASNGGPQLDVVAPGMDITSAQLGGGWITMAGTSMATPHVAGLAALLLERNPSLGPNDIRTLMRANAVDKGALGFDYLYGYGRIDAQATWDAVPQDTAVCGNSLREVGEECDGTDLSGVTCESLGYGSGNLSCAESCTYDVSGCVAGPVCGDGICAGQPNEDCSTCPSDCPGKSGGKPSKRWCCGNLICESSETATICPVDCDSPSICGDGICNPNEDKCNCTTDCGTPPANENGLCSDGIDNDCDNLMDCADTDCSSDSACTQCSTFKQPCNADSDCCTGLSCHPIKKYCK